jgi:hypothetical protein
LLSISLKEYPYGEMLCLIPVISITLKADWEDCSVRPAQANMLARSHVDQKKGASWQSPVISATEEGIGRKITV